MKTLVFGKTGQVAQALAYRLPNAIFLGREEADLSVAGQCRAMIQHHMPDAVINAAAYTAVDRAEEEEALATRINGDAPGEMAQACAALEIPFLHISTDYVFDGSGEGPWQPEDPTGPIGAYGRSKLAGEAAVRSSGAQASILRTAWVFSSQGQNFVKTMLRLAETRDRLTIVADQFGGPTEAGDIADALIVMRDRMLSDPSVSGVYHFAGQPSVSWAEFATEIFAQAGMATQVEAIPSSAYPTPAKRPANSRLDGTKTTQDFGIDMPDWKRSLSRVLRQLEDQHAT